VPTWQLVLVALGVVVAIYAAFVLVLVACGRRADARAMARFIPDAIVLFRRLLGDSAVRRRDKLLLGATIAYLALPIDVVPDFIPVAGQVDDVIVVALVLRAVLRGAGREALQRHWPGPPRSLDLLTRLAFDLRGRGRFTPDPGG
jgi:uncharacterized membrane protein YkvA (DUF1232 family)